jgi:hypothetical protein
MDHNYWRDQDNKELAHVRFPKEPQFEAYLLKYGKTRRLPLSKKVDQL